jgi:hypothetical protein
MRLIHATIALITLAPAIVAAQRPPALPVDRTRPVPSKAETIAAWQRRQAAITSFRFDWTEEQVRPVGWIPNARYPERDRLLIPAITIDRSYTVTKSLAVSDRRMRYGFSIDRPAEPDGVEIHSPDGSNRGLGVRRNYSYESTFDGERGSYRVSSLLGTPPPSAVATVSAPDAQNLDTRVLLMLFRPLDAVMGHLLMERAVTNLARTIYRGRSTYLLEERHDPSGWKTVVRIDPERDFIISEYFMLFEQHVVADIEIDYVRDTKWGWIPEAWRITELTTDGSTRLVSTAKVTKFSINAGMGP